MTRLFVEQLTVIDCACLDAKRGLVGESWIVDLELEGDLDDQSMVLDFGAVRRTLKRGADEGTDHRLLVPNQAPQLEWEQQGKITHLHFASDSGAIEHVAPAAALCLVEAPAITPEAVSQQICASVQKALPDNVHQVTVRLRHEAVDGALYHYAHGLKKHDGLCQRIAHGHRSRLEIRLDGQRDARLERQWAKRWADIYLGTSADVVAHRQGRIRFGYTAAEGSFELELPADRCELLSTDTTVECIAEYIAAAVAAERPGQALEVRAYEGVQKGALARRG